MYCLNIHPGETLQEVIESLCGPVAAVKRAVSKDRPYDIGLRLGSLAADEAFLPARLSALKQTLDESNLRVCHLNGFPYGQFHRTEVKRHVYIPDWSSQQRLEYTLKLAHILARIMPEDENNATISTVPFGYRGLVRVHDCLPLLDEMEARLGDIEAQTGKCIVLAFEPEPDCVVGSVAEALARVPPAKHRTILLDTCHAAVVGERPSECLSQIVQAGFAPLRVQLSAAIVADSSQVETLAGIANSTYLHQTRVYTRAGEPVAEFPDLTDEALDDWWAFARRCQDELVCPDAAHQFTLISFYLVYGAASPRALRRLRRLSSEINYKKPQFGWSSIRLCAVEAGSGKTTVNRMGKPLAELLR